MGIRKRGVLFATLPFLLGANVFYAGKAEAQIELEISAEFYWEIGFTDEAGEFESTGDELRFTFSGTADNGLRYGFDLTLDDLQTVVEPDEAFLFINNREAVLDSGAIDPPSFAFYNNVSEQFEDFADVQFGSVFGIPAGTPEQLNTALQSGQDITLLGLDWVVSDADGTTFAQGITINDALALTAALDNTLVGQAAFQFSGIVPGPEGLLPSPAETENLLYEIRLDRVEVVPLPAAVWFFLGALGSLGVLRHFRGRAA